MDANDAIVIAAIVSGVASIAVALITSRPRIYVTPVVRDGAIPSSPNTIPTTANPSGARSSASVRIFRAIGWLLVAFLYAAALFFAVIALHASSDDKAPSGLPTLLGFFALTVFFISSAAARRLKRSKPSPQSN